MMWENDHLLKSFEIEKIEFEIYSICERYEISPPSHIHINKRLRAVDGRYITYKYENELYYVIDLAYKHYQQFGFQSVVKILRHELAHHICNLTGCGIKHCDCFKELCYELKGVMNSDYAKGKYSHMSYKGIETPYKWLYMCPVCKNSFGTKKKLTHDQYGCVFCECPLENFTIIPVPR